MRQETFKLPYWFSDLQANIPVPYSEQIMLLLKQTLQAERVEHVHGCFGYYTTTISFSLRLCYQNTSRQMVSKPSYNQQRSHVTLGGNKPKVWILFLTEKRCVFNSIVIVTSYPPVPNYTLGNQSPIIFKTIPRLGNILIANLLTHRVTRLTNKIA